MTYSWPSMLLLSLESLQALAMALAEVLPSSTVLLLEGDLGVGKTTFARFFIQALMKEPIFVPSPTFSLVQVYETPRGPLWHCDFYRLQHPEEIFELGLEEALLGKTFCLIEWPEKMGIYKEQLLPKDFLTIHFSLINEKERTITIKNKDGLPPFALDSLPFFAPLFGVP